MSSTSNAPGWDPSTKPFPAARRGDASKSYKSKKAGGKEVVVPEPYEWLHTPPSQSEETKEFVLKQAKLAESYIAGYRELEANFQYPRFSCPSFKGDGSAAYYSYNAGLDPQSTIYRVSKNEVDLPAGDKPAGQRWFDQNLLSKDGTVALSSMSFSKSGKYFAYGISKAGSDWNTIYVREASAPFVEPPTDESTAPSGGPDRLSDVISHVKFSGPVWTHDDKGFFYQRYPEPPAHVKDSGTETDANKDAELFYHVLGTSAKDDVKIVSKDVDIPTSMWSPQISDDGEWLLLGNSKDTDTKSRTFALSLKGQPIGGSMKWKPISTAFDSTLGYIANEGPVFYFMTNKDAPNYKLVKIDLSKIEDQEGHPAKLKGVAPTEDVLPEDPQATLSSASVIAGDKLLVIYLRDVKDELWQLELKTGKKIKRLLPELVGSITQLSGRVEDNTAFVSYMSFTAPGTTVRLDWPEKSSPTDTPTESVYRSTVVANIREEDYISEQIFFPSKDGTKVPMFVTRRKDTKLDGSAPVWLYAYGGFAIPMQPAFSPSLMTWVTLYKGILVFVNARGGSEYGDSWHNEGRLLKKQNTFDDWLAAAKYLVENKYAAKGKIIVNGGSNGGMGAMAVGNQAQPEHGIGAVVAEVGVHDMLRFAEFTIGKAWEADYGKPTEDPEAFDYNYAYSPLHNVDAKKIYPTVLLLSGDHDDRVVPAHTFKMTAELQHKLPNNPNPILARLELDAGHGAGKSTQKRINEACDRYAVVARALSLELVEAPSKGNASL
ncbi:hypothetical protein IE81DRAFT_333060 [Ceraceosorus guamensis]|uniref:Prolyl endopeptidase n=1 Tax=Ceraceosorus guamensis TaxID=1522189 RepID=A0A316W8C7_9BASI|nr:hypothetical protein IE81DRAFT_333060 [Ceraceosorus guamensis]PWN46082.1 hypothetical protein IE81DRAFT_333060 [Ceraceosorus guamensis]